MVYKNRLDGRKANQLRPIEIKAGVIKNADGSAFFRIGKTSAYAAVYGPRNLFPKFKQDPSKGILRCHYSMMPFAGTGDRVRPGQNRRAKEISYVMENALAPVLDLSDYPNSVVDVFVDLPQCDAGSRCAAICAASVALADAGITMKDMVSAVAVGLVDKEVVVDLNYEEEHYPEFAKEKIDSEDVADIPIACIPSTGEITLLQLDGIISKEKVMEGVKLAKQACAEINQLQIKALKNKYGDNNG